jgi:hypothetical protein
MNYYFDPKTSAMIRTIWFMFATIPLMLFVALLGLLSVGMVSPLIIYAGLKGKHLKDPLRNDGHQLTR